MGTYESIQRRRACRFVDAFLYNKKPRSRCRSAVLLGLWIGLLIGLSGYARADCPTTGLPKVFTYGSIAASNALQVGDVIPGTVQAFTLSGKCTTPSTFGVAVVACPGSAPVAGMTGVYPTALAGVGMRMRNSAGTPLVGSGSCAPTSSLGNVAGDGTFNVSGTFELVKTGTIAGGTISGASYSTGVLSTGITLNNGSNTLSVSGSSLRAVTCSVSTETANQVVSLASVSQQSLPAAGAVASRTPFQIGLNCQAGVSVDVTYSSTATPSGIPSVLGSTGNAAGVGVQLLNASQAPIQLDAPTSLTSSTTGNMSFGFYAQYYRLSGSPVTPGTVSAQAVFTMNYR